MLNDHPSKLCAGCGEPIPEPCRPNRIRCHKNCGRGSTRSNASRSAKRATSTVKRFVGIDGEGVDRPDGTHDYNLLSIGGRSLYHPDGRRLDLAEILEFVWSYGVAHPDHILVGFFLGYDYSQWFRQLPESRARMLYTADGIRARQRQAGPNPTPFPVRWNIWELDLLGDTKRLKIRLIDTKRWVYVMDVAPFFQSSLLKALDPKGWPDPVVTDDEFAQIAQGKAARGRAPVPHGTPVDPVDIAYNILENDALGRLMTRLRDGFMSFGVKLRHTQWHGPGQAAQVWMGQVAPDHTGESVCSATPEHILDKAQASYYGGWFEILAHGPVGDVWEYDINSAYPHAIAQLPCLLHGTWRQVEPGSSPPDRLALVHVKVNGRDKLMGPMPYRTHEGRVMRPRVSSGWHWWHELLASRAAGLEAGTGGKGIDEQWEYEPCSCPPPFAAIAELYQRRIRDGGIHKNGPDGKALKLLYNSAYGKMAQSVGAPKYANPIYASLITSRCRTMILEAIATHPEKSEAVVMVATDGIYFTSPHPSLELSPTKLGAWDEAHRLALWLFKPGVYWSATDGNRSLSIKSRGVGMVSLQQAIPEIEAQWDRLGEHLAAGGAYNARAPWPTVELNIRFAIISPRQALHRGAWGMAGSIVHEGINVQSANPIRKRSLRGATPGQRHRFPSLAYGAPARTIDGATVLQIETTPYDHRFGRPDETGPMTPDGPAAFIFGEMFGTNFENIEWS